MHDHNNLPVTPSWQTRGLARGDLRRRREVRDKRGDERCGMGRVSSGARHNRYMHRVRFYVYFEILLFMNV